MLMILLLAACADIPDEHPGKGLKVMALDSCADQYVLALGGGHELALTPRADDPDSFMAQAAHGHRRMRPTLEGVVAFAPDVVVRLWGGDARLLAELERRGVTVVNLPFAADFAAVETGIRETARVLGREAEGRGLIDGLRADLAMGAQARRERPLSALYLTSGGFTTGEGTLVDAALKAAGLENAAGFRGFGPVRVERLALEPPERFVLGFHDQSRLDRRGAGRHPLVMSMVAARPHVTLPAEQLICPAWFTAGAVPHLLALRGMG